MRDEASSEPTLDQKKARKEARSGPDKQDGGRSGKARAYKSYKRPSFIGAVLARHAAGDSGRATAKELGVARATVERVLKQPGIEEKAQQTLERVQIKVLADFEKNVEEARTVLQAKIPELMKMAVNDTLEKRDRSLAHEMVKRAGVYPEKDRQSRPNVMLQDNRLRLAIQQLIPGRKEAAPADTLVTSVTPVIDAQIAVLPDQAARS